MSEAISLTSLEDKFVLRKNLYRRNRPGLYPSEASVEYVVDGDKVVDGKCLRAAWYRNKQVPKTDPSGPKLMQTANLGKWDETGLITRWKEMGLWVDNNIKFYRQDLVLSGELDAILKILDKLIGYEVKTFYGYNAQRQIYGSKKPLVYGIPKDNHLLQALIYSWEYRNELDEYRLYYLERGDGSRCEFAVGCDETTDPSGTHRCWYKQIPGDYWNSFSEDIVYLPYSIEDIHDRYRQLIKYIRENIMPPTDFEEVYSAEKIQKLWSQGKIAKTNYEKWTKKPSNNPIGDWQCSYCDWKSRCKADSIKEIIDIGE